MENNMEQTPQPISPTTHPAYNTTTPKPKKKFDLRYLFLLLIFVGIGGGIWTATRESIQPLESVPTPSTLPIPTRTSKPPIAAASQSGYLDLIQNVSSLSAHISTIQITDTTLSPPTIELPLGFPNE